MPVRFAWPVCQVPSSEYPALDGTIVAGRRFCQPVFDADPALTVDGLELWLAPDSEASALYACFDGLVTYVPPHAGEPAATLVLEPGILERADLKTIRQLEPVVNGLSWVNVDAASVSDAFNLLIADAFANRTSANPHPILADYQWQGQRLDVALQNAPNRAELIATIVASWMNPLTAPGMPPNALVVRAGDRMGRAADPTGVQLPPPQAPGYRQLVWKVYERCDRVRDPRHDLWRWLDAAGRANPVVQLLSPHALGTASPHPMLAAIDFHLDGQRYAPRVDTTPTLQPLPRGPLATAHTLALQSPVGAVRFDARFDWWISDQCAFQGQLRPGQPLAAGEPANAPVTTPTQFRVQLVDRMWNPAAPATDLGPHISFMARAFQVPCELIMGFLGKETANLASLAVRFEPVDVPGSNTPPDRRRQRLDAATIADPVLGPEYTALVVSYRQAVPGTATNGGGTSANAPDPWNGAAVVTPGQAFTFGNMARLLELSVYFRDRISPGLMQTLVGTAMRTLQWVRDTAAADIEGTYPLPTGPAASWSAYFGVEPPPLADPSLFLRPPPGAPAGTRGWLLVPRQSIMAGTAYVRKEYNEDARGTCWDPPRVAGAYNSGKVQPPILGANPPAALVTYKRSWGQHFYADSYANDYLIPFAQTYNAAVQRIDATPGGPGYSPVVRIRR